jgi:tetratricopeptide (TPR) repeat protein
MTDDATRHSDRVRRRLESWKEIAGYFDRDVRTVQRWERRDALPVHRLQHSKLGSVFAYSDELDAWRDGRDINAIVKPAAGSSALRIAQRWRAAAALAIGLGVGTSGDGLLRDPSRPDALLSERQRVSADLEAVTPLTYESYLKGLFHFGRGTRADIQQSIQYFERVTHGSPRFAPAYVGLASAYSALGSTGIGADAVANVHPRALAAASRALELDPNLASAHAVVARAHQQAWRWAQAEADYRRALAIDPDHLEAHSGLASLLIWSGRTAAGLEHARRTRELDPLSVQWTVRLGWFLYHAREYQDAIREFRTVLAANPEHFSAQWFLGFALLDSGGIDEAVHVLERLVERSDRNPAAVGLLARAYGASGRHDDAVAMLEELKQREHVGYVPPAPFLHAYLGLGDRENAFAALERAYRERSNILQFLITHPAFDQLRDDSRYAELIRRVGLSNLER